MLRPLPPSCARLKDLSAGLLHPFTTQVTPFSTFPNLLTLRSTRYIKHSCAIGVVAQQAEGNARLSISFDRESVLKARCYPDRLDVCRPLLRPPLCCRLREARLGRAISRRAPGSRFWFLRYR